MSSTFREICSRCVQGGLITVFLVLPFAPALAGGLPVVMYTDILSGPNTGGEDNKGIYLSIFGMNFGTSQGNSKVYINNVEVGSYKYWGPSRGRPDIQQISVQPGPNVSSGAIKVVVDGVSSNTDHTFTVRSGDIYFVALNGNDGTGVANDITKPYRHAQHVIDLSAYGPGDVAVVRGGTWTDQGDYGTFINFTNKAGTIANPLMIMGYPGETVTIDNNSSGEDAFQVYRNDGVPQGGYAISNFRRVTDWGCLSARKSEDGNPQINGLRFVNCECSGMHGSGGGTGNLGGGADNLFILGNNVHHNGDTKLYHGIYVSNPHGENWDMENIEIAYNWVHHQDGGRGIQIYTGSGPTRTFKNVLIHDNLIHDIELHPITLSDHSSSAKVYNNIIYNASNGTGEGSTGAIQFNWDALDAEVYNNTIYNVARGACIDNQEANSAVIRNNICHVLPGQDYSADDSGYDWDAIITASNNIWYGGGSPPSWDDNPITANPDFVNAGAANFHVQPGSPALDGGVVTGATRDHEGIARPQGVAYDVGAYEGAGEGEPTGPPGPPGNVDVN